MRGEKNKIHHVVCVGNQIERTETLIYNDGNNLTSERFCTPTINLRDRYVN